MSLETNVLARNQPRLDAIGSKFHEHELLDEKQIDQLAHDLGEIEDAGAAFQRCLDRVLGALGQYPGEVKQCHFQLLQILGWFDEFRRHMKSGGQLIKAACKRIKTRHPEALATGEEE
jgi:hypothetical protein